MYVAYQIQIQNGLKCTILNEIKNCGRKNILKRIPIFCRIIKKLTGRLAKQFEFILIMLPFKT